MLPWGAGAGGARRVCSLSADAINAMLCRAGVATGDQTGGGGVARRKNERGVEVGKTRRAGGPWRRQRTPRRRESCKIGKRQAWRDTQAPAKLAALPTSNGWSRRAGPAGQHT